MNKKLSELIDTEVGVAIERYRERDNVERGVAVRVRTLRSEAERFALFC